MEEGGTRLNKFLSESGICSRREADRLISDGKVTVEGKAAEAGQKVKKGQTVVCDGRTVTAGARGAEQKPERVLLAVNKPCGIVCTTSDKDRAPNIVDMVDFRVRIYPVGRLDKDSEGLILMTNQGDLVNRIMKSANGHEKEYQVWIDRPVTPEMIQKLKKGVYLPELDVTTKPCKAEKTGEKSFRIVLTQGLNRQIRRMCEQTGCHVKKLKRVRILNIELGDLKAGESRPVTKREYAELMRQLDGVERNQKEPVKDGQQRGDRQQDRRTQGDGSQSGRSQKQDRRTQGDESQSGRSQKQNRRTQGDGSQSRRSQKQDRRTQGDGSESGRSQSGRAQMGKFQSDRLQNDRPQNNKSQSSRPYSSRSQDGQIQKAQSRDWKSQNGQSRKS